MNWQNGLFFKVTPKYFLLNAEFLLTLHQKPDDNYSRLQFSPEMFLQTKISFSPKKLTNSILSHLLFSFIFQMHNQCWFSIWSHIFLGEHCISLVGQGSPTDQRLFKTNLSCGMWTPHCGGLIVWDVEAPEQKNVRLRLMQHVVNPPEEEGVNSTL